MGAGWSVGTTPPVLDDKTVVRRWIRGFSILDESCRLTTYWIYNRSTSTARCFGAAKNTRRGLGFLVCESHIHTSCFEESGSTRNILFSKKELRRSESSIAYRQGETQEHLAKLFEKRRKEAICPQTYRAAKGGQPTNTSKELQTKRSQARVYYSPSLLWLPELKHKNL